MPLDDKKQRQFNTVCERIAGGESLQGICAEMRKDDPKAFPAASTVLLWKDSAPELAECYARAKEERGEFHGNQVLTKAMDETIEPNSRKIMVDALKWTASKLYPRVYGDKLALGGADDLPAIKQEVQERADGFTEGIVGLANRATTDKATKH